MADNEQEKNTVPSGGNGQPPQEKGRQNGKGDPAPKTKSYGLFRRIPAADVDLATDIRTTILIQSPKGGRFILWGVFLFIVLFFVWAYQAEIEEVTRGMGKVIPSQQIQVIQNLEGGILAEIYVHEG
jgi:adhesin transport system membrane fusion protein